MNALKAMWTVKGGILPGEADPQYTRVWSLMAGSERESDADRLRRFHATKDEAMAYASDLTNPGFVNWVTLEFLWI